MDRRDFLSTAVVLPAAMAATARGNQTKPIGVREFHSMRKFIELPVGRIAYVERGRGPIALFFHGLPLNGYQWRGALERLSPYRRCVAPDFLGLGYTEAKEGADLRPEAQVAMMVAFLDQLGEKRVDLIASDSGGAAAQLFAALHPNRVRTLLLTNCDAGADCPPQVIVGAIAEARAGVASEKNIRWLSSEREIARSSAGLGVAYTQPGFLTDELLDVYLGPLVKTSSRQKQFNALLLGLEKNFLLPLEPDLKRLQSPVRIVWGAADTIFKSASPDYLDHLFPNSRGVRRIDGAQLFWPEEFPAILAEEARTLWGV